MLCSESEGRKMYYITYFLQFTTLLLCNMGFILLGARALKVHQFVLDLTCAQEQDRQLT